MTDYAAAATTSEPSWTWWMTTAAAAAVRMRNFRDHHRGGEVGGDLFNEHPDDEYAGPNRKRQRIDSGGGRDEFWNTCGVYERDDGGSRQTYDPVAAGPLDLSVKAMLTASAHIVDERREVGDGRSEKDVNEYRATTPVKRPAATAGISNSKSSKKTTGSKTAASGKATTSGTPSAAVKAATRKLLPQLLMDQRVDRSSPVSGTIIVPATPEDPTTPPPQSYDSGDAGDRDDDYEGGDIDPEFNVVVVTEEARRRLESIPNALGPYKCKLCSVRYSDAFALARHRCRCIVHVRYRCPECDKVFQCPANLASHRRWHGGSAGTTPKTSGGNGRTKNTCNSGLDKQEAAVAAAAVTVVADNVAVKQEETTTATNNNNNNNNYNNNIDDDDTDGVAVGGRGKTAGGAVAAVPTAVAGFKKNILHRAVQAAAAAANNDDVTGAS